MHEETLPVRKVSFREAVIRFFANYAVLSGRATRREYWFAFLFQMAVSLFLTLLSHLEVPVVGLIHTVFSWGTLIPGLTVTIRRLHDTGKSGWNLLFNLVPILGTIMFVIMLCLGSEEDNDYGPKPVAEPQ